MREKGVRDDGRGRRCEGERLSVKEEGSGAELGSDLDPWKILWIRIRQNDADPLDPDPQHWSAGSQTPNSRIQSQMIFDNKKLKHTSWACD